VQNELLLLNLLFLKRFHFLLTHTMALTEQTQGPSKTPPLSSVEAVAQARKEKFGQWYEHQKKVDERRTKQLEKRKEKLVERVDGSGGRPPLVEEELRLHAVTVRLDTHKYRQLCAYAASGGRTVAATVRAVLDDIPQLTTEQNELLRHLPNLVNNANQIARVLNGRGQLEGIQLADLALRIEALLNSFHH
jgi:hypothetical protein